jgi:HEAT repeat protein
MISNDLETRIAMIEAIGLAPKDMRVELWRALINAGLLSDQRPRTRIAILSVIRDYPPKELQQFVLAAFQDKIAIVRTAAAATLISADMELLINVRRVSPPPPLKGDPYWMALLPILRGMATSDSESENRQAAVRILAAFDPDERTLVATLFDAARDSSHLVAVEAVSALGKLGPPALSALKGLVDCRREFVTG